MNEANETPKFSPLPPSVQRAVLVNPEPGYEIHLKWNEKAELTDVAYPSNFGLGLLAEHLAVALKYVADELAKGES